tara:strand:- start:11047 stop:11601 length:555 start_codon:yes stop_codon:yes gene_type:complete
MEKFLKIDKKIPDLRSTGSACILKPMTIHHATNEYVGWLNDKNINQYLESRYQNHTIISVKDFIKENINDENTIFYAIHSIDNLHIGNIKLDINPIHLRGDIGFIIGNSDYHGKGIATSAISLLCSYAFKIGLQKVTAGAYENNIGSSRALQKCGFIQEGYLSDQVIFNNKRIGTYIYGLRSND